MIKVLKKSTLILLCMLLIGVMLPTCKVNASTIKKQGYYLTLIATKKTATKRASGLYLKKVKLSGSKLTTYGNYVYYKSYNAMVKSTGNYKELKVRKRTFTLSKKVKIYADGDLGNNKVSRISKKTAMKALKKLNANYCLGLNIKNKKVTKIYICEF